jgi:hypothetical protein
MADSVDLDRLKEAFDDSVAYALPNVDYYALYTCQVTAQNADGTLDLTPNRTDWPTQKKIPFRCGIPGVKITVNAGAQVLLGWENGDPSVPFCGLWLTGTTGDLQTAQISAATEIDLLAPTVKVGNNATLAAARETDTVAITLADISQFIFTAPSGGGPCVVTGPPQIASPTTAINSGSSEVTIG